MSILVAVEHVRAVLDALLGEADLVVIDGGAIQQSAGALTWARAAEETVLVVRRGSTRREELRLAAESLRFVDAAIGGTVLVQRPSGRSALRRPFGRRVSRSGSTAAERRPIRSGGPTAMASAVVPSPIGDGTTPFTPRPMTVAPTISQPAFQPPVTIPSIVPSSSRSGASDERNPGDRPVAPIIPMAPPSGPGFGTSPDSVAARAAARQRQAQSKQVAPTGETAPAEADEYGSPKRRAAGRTQRPPVG